MITGKVCAVDHNEIPDTHPVDWLRNRRTIGVASHQIDGATIGGDVVVLTADEFAAVQMLARLARGCSWPGEMADTVDRAAAQFLDTGLLDTRPLDARP